MSVDSAGRVPPHKHANLQHLPDVVAVQVHHVRYKTPRRFTVQGKDHHITEAVEIVVEMSEPLPIRALKRPPPKGDIQPDLFAANFADIPIRDQRDTMERPFFSLAKKPRFAPIEYRVGDVWVEVSANPKFGIATIWDADILIWASTQVTEARDRGQPTSRVVHFYPHNLLKSIRRPTGGEHYLRLRAALERLTHT